MKSSVWTITIPVPAAFTRLVSLPISSAKEIRAILPAAVCGSALGAFALIAWSYSTTLFTFFLYPLTCSAIGAIAFGHDYTNRTLASFLALPIPRSTIWWTRLRLSFFAMLPLSILLIASLYSPLFWTMISDWDVTIESPWHQLLYYAARTALVPILSGLFLAPWLTLISRSPLFGTVVSMLIPFILGLLSAPILRAVGYIQPDALFQQLGLIPMTVLSVVFGILGWRKFQLLEVLDGEFGATSRVSTRTIPATQQFRRHSALIQLVKKDLLLLRMPIALAIAAMALVILLDKEQAALWTLIYPATIVLLIVAVASADERQLGVAEWQVLMPVPFWKQWTIKFFVTWLTALIVGLALPIALLFYKTGEMEKLGSTDLIQVAPIFIAASFEFVALTLYISSLCNSSLKALIAAIMVNVSAAYMIMQFFEAYSNLLWTDGIVGSRDYWEPLPNGARVQRTMAVPSQNDDWWCYWQFWPFLIAIFGIAVLALILAMRNHRYAERGPSRLLRQVTGFAAYEAAAALAIVTFWNWYTWLR